MPGIMDVFLKNADKLKPLLLITLLPMEQAKVSWYHKLLDECRSLAERFRLDETSSEELMSFIVRVAKDQYKIGNKSGIRWAFNKQKEGTSQTSSA
jgi:hypothetical protein